MTNATISIFEAKRPLEERLYFEMVLDAAARSRDLEISNGKPAHAVYLIWKLFDTARSSIRILSDSLRRELKDGDGHIWVYGDPRICDAAVDFLRNGGKMDVLVEDDVEKGADHEMLAAIKNAGLLDHVAVGKLPKQDGDDHGQPFHFLLCDKRAFRVETDKKKHTAFANFNDAEMVEILGDHFDVLKDAAMPVRI